MFKFIKKWFRSADSSISKNNTFEDQISKKERIVVVKTQTDHSIVQNDVEGLNDDNYEFGFGNKQLSDFELLILNLRSYSGYIRQKTLEQISDHYDEKLFPHLLDRLSDYVESNRKLAVEHFNRWSERPDFPELCINYFLEISNLKQRYRTDHETLDLLIAEVAKNKALFSEVLISQQGKLPRELFKFILAYQWINHKELLALSRIAKDQKIRAYWLNHLVENESVSELLNALKQSQFKDIQYHLFDVLYRKGELTTADLILFWHSKFASIMDYAYFGLRQQKFDFEEYFKDNPINNLTATETRIRAKQWILFKGDIETFFNLIKQINEPKVINSLIFLALKQNYLSVEKSLDYFAETQQLIEPSHISKLNKNSSENIDLTELNQYLALIQTPISIQQRLSLVNDYRVWDQLYWFVIQHQYVQIADDKKIFEQHVAQYLPNLVYSAYGERWSNSQKTEMQTLLPAFVQFYPKIFADERLKQLLKFYLK